MKNPISIALVCAMILSTRLFAESQGSEYKGVTDPFGDPTNYEFAEDEKEDKEFFHLGRYLMFGIDAGAGIFTGGLGRTNSAGFYVGAHLLYFFDRSIALEVAGHYSNHLDSIIPDAASQADYNVNLIPITLGFRYYFDTRNAPKAIAIANPYLNFGGGGYMRQQTLIAKKGNITTTDGNTTSFGGYGGAGVEFAIYRRHIYFGVDLRYHMIFFPDEGDATPNPGDRAGDYFSSAITLTYNF